MVVQFCASELEKLGTIVHELKTLTLVMCVLFLAFSVVVILGNLLVIRALWKASSIPGVLKKLFLSLAVSDLAVGLFAQPMLGVILAVMVKMAASGDHNFERFCPTVLIISYFSLFFLSSASFLNVTAIAVDRLLAIFLHLRYREFVTPKRVVIALVSLWLTSGIGAFIYITLPNNNDRVSNVLMLSGLVVTTVANLQIYRTVRHHRNQIQRQCQLQNGEEMEIKRQRKSTLNTLYFYVVFVVCYVPFLCCTLLLSLDRLRVSFLAGYAVAVFLFLLHSSLNPIVYCWRYREIREISRNIIKNIIRMT